MWKSVSVGVGTIRSVEAIWLYPTSHPIYCFRHCRHMLLYLLLVCYTLIFSEAMKKAWIVPAGNSGDIHDKFCQGENLSWMSPEYYAILPMIVTIAYENKWCYINILRRRET